MAGTPHSNPQNKKKPSRKQCAHKQYSDKFKQKIVDKFKFHKSHNPKLTVTDFAKLVNIKYTIYKYITQYIKTSTLSQTFLNLLNF